LQVVPVAIPRRIATKWMVRPGARRWCARCWAALCGTRLPEFFRRRPETRTLTVLVSLRGKRVQRLDLNALGVKLMKKQLASLGIGLALSVATILAPSNSFAGHGWHGHGWHGHGWGWGGVGLGLALGGIGIGLGPRYVYGGYPYYGYDYPYYRSDYSVGELDAWNAKCGTLVFVLSQPSGSGGFPPPGWLGSASSVGCQPDAWRRAALSHN
jgi:hypothetical protein